MNLGRQEMSLAGPQAVLPRCHFAHLREIDGPKYDFWSRRAEFQIEPGLSL